MLCRFVAWAESQERDDCWRACGELDDGIVGRSGDIECGTADEWSCDGVDCAELGGLEHARGWDERGWEGGGDEYGRINVAVRHLCAGAGGKWAGTIAAGDNHDGGSDGECDEGLL